MFNPAEDAAFAQAIEPVPQFAHDAAVAHATRAVVSDGTTFDSAAKSQAGNTGMDPEKAMQMVTEAYDHFERVVHRTIAPQGITGPRIEAFYAFTKGKPRQLQEAIQLRTLLRDPAGFKALGAEFNRLHPATR